jgi:hypothetical protein
MFVSSRYNVTTSDLDRFGIEAVDHRGLLLERFKFREDRTQRWPGDGFDDQS